MTTTATLDAAKPASPQAPDDEQAKALDELLNTGKFAAYHLLKAKRALAADDIANAQYQISASLAHDSLPEAVALKAELKQRAKSR